MENEHKRYVRNQAKKESSLEKKTFKTGGRRKNNGRKSGNCSDDSYSEKCVPAKQELAGWGSRMGSIPL